MSKSFELRSAYGRQPRTKAEALKLWRDDFDWDGDWQLGFKLVNRSEIEQHFAPCAVLLRYASDRRVAVVDVPRSTGGNGDSGVL